MGGMETLSAGLAKHLPSVATVQTRAWGGSQRWLPAVFAWFTVSLFSHAGKTDVVLLGDAVLAPLGWLAKRFLGKRVICLLHGLDLTYQHPLYRFLRKTFSYGFDAYVCNSRATEAEARRQGYRNVHVIHPGIDPVAQRAQSEARRLLLPLVKHRPPEHAFWIGFLGRASERKGLPWFIQHVFPTLPEHVHLFIAGSTPEADVLSWLPSPALLSRVHVFGRIPDDVRALFLPALDLFLMPNVDKPGDQEGFGIAAIEASAAGTPVLAAEFEGVADAVLHGRTGWLLTPGDPEAFSEAIRGFASPSRYAELNAVRLICAHETIAAFGWEHQIEEYGDLLAGLRTTDPVIQRA